MRTLNQRMRFGPSSCYSVIKKFWEPRISDNIRNVKAFRDGSGVVFDLKSDYFEGFMDNFARLKETSSDKVDFDVMKCAELPDLDDDGQGGVQNWRDNGRDGYNRGGYQRGGGGYQRGGGYGGYNRGGGYSNNYDDGGWGNNRRDDGQGWGNKFGGNRGADRGRGRGGYDNRRPADDYGDDNGG